MKKRWIAAIIVVFVALFALRPRPQPAADTPAPASAPVPANTAPGASTAASPSAPDAPPSPRETDTPPPADAPTATIPETPEAVRDTVENVQFALRDFRTVLGENPIGSNAEITKALLGQNLKQVKIPIPAGSTLNGEGEMCDHWGTPYFFHQLSGKQMEIHSAGPDRKLGTSDDIIVK